MWALDKIMCYSKHKLYSYFDGHIEYSSGDTYENFRLMQSKLWTIDRKICSLEHNSAILIAILNMQMSQISFTSGDTPCEIHMKNMRLLTLKLWTVECSLEMLTD